MSKRNRIINVFGSCNWIYNSRKSNFDDADIIVMPGGSDIDPAFYGHKRISGTYVNPSSDQKEWNLLNKAIDAGKAIFGICKGLQFLNVRAGAWLIQDSKHPSSHLITTRDGEIIPSNSCHHQQCFIYDLPKDEYELIAWAEHLSPFHVDQKEENIEYPEYALDKNGKFMEPEIVSFPKLNALGAQFHPEWLETGRAVDYLNSLIRSSLKF